MKQTLRPRGRALVAAALVAVGTAGCSVNSPFQTSETKSLADGVPVDLETVQVRNLALVSGGEGGDATVTGAVENVSGEELTLTVTAGTAKASTKVPAHTTLNLSEDTKVTLKAVDAGPGDMTSVEISDGTDSTPVDIPVLDPAGYYETYAPEGWTPTPTPTESEEHGESEEH